jgi:hypothetical protein
VGQAGFEPESSCQPQVALLVGQRCDPGYPETKFGCLYTRVEEAVGIGDNSVNRQWSGK